MGGVQGRVQLRGHLVAPERRAVHRLSPAAGGLLAPAGGAWRLQQTNTAIGCNNCLMNIHDKIILFYFRRGSMLK